MAAGDLFRADGERLPVADAELRFWPAYYDSPTAARLFSDLMAETPWRAQAIRLWGREVMQPRLVAWHADAGVRYGYSGIVLEAAPWGATAQRIRADVEEACGHRFNCVLLNLYRDGRDSMGWHSDDEAELGREPAIASVSLGATRRFRLRHKAGRAEPLGLELSDGSLLLMAGPTQHCWQHAVPRSARVLGPRINLTFRYIEPQGAP